MKVVKSVTLTLTLVALSFNFDGSLDATFRVMLVDLGLPPVIHHISPDNASTILDTPLPEGQETMRGGIVAAVITHLFQQGLLTGTVE